MYKITSNFQWFFKITFVFVIINLLIRIFDFSLIQLHQASGLMSFVDLLKALFFDAMIALSISGLLLIFYILFSLINKIFARIFIAILLSVFIIVNIGLILYFDQIRIPLDQVIYVYRFSSIIDILQVSGGTSMGTIYPIILGLASFIALAFVFNKIRFSHLIVNIGLILTIIAAASTNVFIVKPNNFSSEDAYYCNLNKPIYFIKRSISYFKNRSESFDNFDRKKVIKYQDDDPNHRIFISALYPFYHKMNDNSNLAEFFNELPNGGKPNIVFIIVESLCRDLSGKYTPNYSFTPFLDSLTEHSLYWRNTLSSSERTFGVLPTVLASLPPSKTGFMDENKKFPRFISLPKLLKDNGYSTQMFYGGWSGFTYMDKFVYKSGIDSIYNKFPNSDKMPAVEKDFTWGYGDEVIFKQSFKHIDSTDNPYFSLYLTLSTHTPFSINNQQKYIDGVNKLLDKIKNKKTFEYVSNHQHELATFLMFDEQLRLFFQEYSKRDDYSRTIFVITGDHKSILFPKLSNLDKYHVPLVIYSPLLKQNKEFGAVASHFDIAPAITKLLRTKYNLNMPNYSQYLGDDLDTNTNFYSNQRLFFMRNSRVVDEYLYKDILVATDKLYKINDLFESTPITNDSLRDSMKKQIEDYMKMQIYTVESNMLIENSPITNKIK